MQVVRLRWHGQDCDAFFEEFAHLPGVGLAADGAFFGFAVVDAAGFVGEAFAHVLRAAGRGAQFGQHAGREGLGGGCRGGHGGRVGRGLDVGGGGQAADVVVAALGAGDLPGIELVLESVGGREPGFEAVGLPALEIEDDHGCAGNDHAPGPCTKREAMQVLPSHGRTRVAAQVMWCPERDLNP